MSATHTVSAARAAQCRANGWARRALMITVGELHPKAPPDLARHPVAAHQPRHPVMRTLLPVPPEPLADARVVVGLAAFLVGLLNERP